MPGLFKFFLSKDVPFPFKIKIDRLEAIPHTFQTKSPYQMLYITCELWYDGIILCEKSTTTFQTFEENTLWNQWLHTSIKYRDIPFETVLHVKVWDAHSPGKQIIIGQAEIPLFSTSTRRVKEGRIKIKLRTPGEDENKPSTSVPSAALDELERLEKLMKKFNRNKMPRVEWLDKKVIVEFEKTKQKAMQGCGGEMFLHLEFATFDYPVIFSEAPIPSQKPSSLTINEPHLVHDFYDDQNPVEMKYLKLAHRSSMYDKDLKPDQSVRVKIERIIAYPPQKPLTTSEKELIWKFRYFIANISKALPKFLQCVDWKDPQNVVQGVEMIDKWEPMDPTGALELLTKQFKHIEVRKYAVRRLEEAADEEILSYLLQLVQAMGTERTGEIPLTDFLIKRACKNFDLGNYFHWYLTVESLRNDNRGKCFKKKLRLFHLALSLENDQMLKQLKRGEELIKILSTVQKDLRELQHNRPKKIEIFKRWLSEKGRFSELYRMPQLALPLDPSKEIIGVIPEKATIFKSAMSPLGIRFLLSDDSDYMILFKSGDDLRQDQFVVQLITLMDKLLKYENLDLQLTPYRVLATGFSEGILECVSPSQSIASVLKSKEFEGNIQKYLRAQAGDYNNKLDTFVRSCAGYCVITYILGIGDRHLDNLLITPQGNLFHIDFGFILGRDPKLLPPPMKLCKEMVEGMGGDKSEHYLKFKEHCCEAYNILRKSSNLILNLFQLMLDADIPDISEEADKAILKVQEKFRLELSDEEAGKLFQSLINESVSALAPQINEVVHRWAQYWRA